MEASTAPTPNEPPPPGPIRLPGTLRLLPEAVYEALCGASQLRRNPADTTLASPGETCDEVLIVLTGALSVQEVDPETAESYPVAYLGKGEIYGAHSVRESATHRFHLITVADTDIAVVPRDAWAAALQADPSGLLERIQAPAIRRVLHELQARAASSGSLARLATGLTEQSGLESLEALFPSGQPIRALAIVTAGAVRHGETLVEAGQIIAHEALVMRTPCMYSLEPVESVDVLVMEPEALVGLLKDEPRLERAFRWWAAERAVSRTYGRPAIVTDLDHVPPDFEDEDEDVELPAKGHRVGMLENKPFYYQRDEMDCGAACMRMITRYYGHEVSYTGLRTLARVSRYGTSLWDLSEAAEAMGYIASALQLDWDHLNQVDLPAIAHLADRQHYVVIWRVTKKRVLLGDPGFGNHWIPKEKFLDQWRGIVLLLKPTDRLAENTRKLLSLQDDETNRAVLWRLWETVRPFRPVLLHVVAASVVLQLIGLVPPLATQVILDRVLMGWDEHLLVLIFSVLVGAAVFRSIVAFARTYLVLQTSAKLERTLVESIYRRVMHNQSFFARLTTSDLLTRFGEVQAIKQFFLDNLVSILIDLMVIVLYSIILINYNIGLSGVVAGVVLIHVAILAVVGRTIRGYTFMAMESGDKYRTHLMDSLRGHRVVQAHSLERGFKNKFSHLLAPAIEHGFRAGLAGYIGGAAFGLVETLGRALVLFLGARIVLEGQLSIGELIAFTLIAAQVSAPIARLAAQVRHWHRIVVNLHRVNDLLTGPENDDGYDSAVMDLPASRGHIAFAGTTFHYPRDIKEKRNNAIENCTFEILPGEVVAICGRSGCGKSTLISLMLRLYDPQDGTIWLDGFNLRDLTPESVRRQFGLVTQDITLFAGTIYENIACGRRVREQAVIEAAKVAGAMEFISELPYGFHTLIGEKGLKLSGGQHQRIVIARALVTDPKILIFDEAMASLDPLSESLIHGRLEEVIAGRTTIVISHRLSSLRNANRILVMDKGRIVELGTHEQLIAKEGLYLSLVDASPGWRREVANAK